MVLSEVSWPGRASRTATEWAAGGDQVVVQTRSSSALAGENAARQLGGGAVERGDLPDECFGSLTGVREADGASHPIGSARFGTEVSLDLTPMLFDRILRGSSWATARRVSSSRG